MLGIAWNVNDSSERAALGRGSTISNTITFLDTKYQYVGSILHTLAHFYALVSFEDRLWGPPLLSGGCVDYSSNIYNPRGDLPHVTPDGQGYSVLHCYTLDMSDDEE
jgi:hypothetical protein